MFQDIFKNRIFIGVLALFVFCVAGSLLYMHHKKQKGNERLKPIIHYEAPDAVDTSQVVDIPDPNLRAAIAEALNKAPEDAITDAEMETLGELEAQSHLYRLRSENSPSEVIEILGKLEAQGRQITNLRGIEFAINLTRLNVSNNTISDISPVASLTNLRTLFLAHNTISDISPVASLTNLRTLFLGHNTISDISPLANFTSLLMLFLGHNTISDISPLANLEMGALFLEHNAISDISPLTNHTNLRELHIEHNAISDISFLTNHTNLMILTLEHNAISDISPLANLKNLLFLDLQHNAISDIETLERLMAQGTTVYFSGNPAFETPGPKIEDGWVWQIVPATNAGHGSRAAHSGRDFLKEASGGAVTEADVAVNGARAGTQVGNSVWTPAPLKAADRDNLDTIVSGYNFQTDIDTPVAYGVVSVQSETPQQTRLYISTGPVKVWFNGTMLHRDVSSQLGSDYVTAVPVQLIPGENLLFIAAYKSHLGDGDWGASFGFQDGTLYTTQSP